MDYLLESDYLYDQGQIEMLNIALESTQYLQEDVKSVAKKAWNFILEKIRNLIKFIKELFTKKIPEVIDRIKNGKSKIDKLKKNFAKGKKIKVEGVYFEYVNPAGMKLCKFMIENTKKQLDNIAYYTNNVDKYAYSSTEEFEEDLKNFKDTIKDLNYNKEDFDEKKYFQRIKKNYINTMELDRCESFLAEAEKLIEIAKPNCSKVLSVMENLEKQFKRWEQVTGVDEESIVNNRSKAALVLVSATEKMKFYALKSVDLASKQISFQTKNISIIEGIIGKRNSGYEEKQTSNSKNMDTKYEAIENGIAKNDVKALREAIGSIPYTNRDFSNGEFDKLVKYVESKGIQLKDKELKGNPTISSQKTDFTDEDFARAIFELKKNFCDERIKDVKIIGKKLYGKKKI